MAALCSRLRFVVLIDCNSFRVDRGGAMRGVAKLVASFVPSFETHKFAFTFVFTKSDFLGEAHSLAEARTLLKATLVETLKGSVDGDIKAVLNWMCTCLHANYPFVHIFRQP